MEQHMSVVKFVFRKNKEVVTWIYLWQKIFSDALNSLKCEIFSEEIKVQFFSSGCISPSLFPLSLLCWFIVNTRWESHINTQIVCSTGDFYFFFFSFAQWHFWTSGLMLNQTSSDLMRRLKTDSGVWLWPSAEEVQVGWWFTGVYCKLTARRFLFHLLFVVLLVLI